ncbi:Antithrombin-III [Bulinus truncatus]|nr:Antithrombin-III [Bulinus truncatus]
MISSKFLVLCGFLILLTLIALIADVDAVDGNEMSIGNNEISRLSRAVDKKNRNKYQNNKRKKNNSAVQKKGRKSQFSPEEKLGIANSYVALNVFTHQFPSITTNTVFSPHSLHTALAMTMTGAKKDTRKELFSALGLKAAKVSQSDVHTSYRRLLTSLSGTHPEVTLSNANGVFIQPGLELKNQFRKVLTQNYNATVDNFHMTDPQGPEHPINIWVANATRGKIKDFLEKGSIKQDTAMLIVNTLFLNATWQVKFKTEQTKPRPFTSLHSGVTQIPTMQTTDFFNYVNHHNTEVIELPFSGSDLFMYILLPNLNLNLDQLLQNMKASTAPSNPMDELLSGFQMRNLKLFLPKFKIDSGDMDLVESLKRLGINKAFKANEADFRAIARTGRQKLFISKVVQKAVIDVNEFGCEAAAVTSVGFVLTSLRITPEALEVKVDRPFLYIIRSKKHKVVLFMGSVVNPSA